MNTHRALRPFRTPVRGHAFAAPPPDHQPLVAGTNATLAREPSNPADPLAVAVWVHDGRTAPWRMGYLDRAVAARLAPRMDAGATVRAQVDGWVAEPDGRWQRPIVLLQPTAPRNCPADVNGPAARPTFVNRPPGVRRRRVR